METTFVKVKVYKRSAGKRCLHCGSLATVTAFRKGSNGVKLPVRYCAKHAEVRGVPGCSQDQVR